MEVPELIDEFVGDWRLVEVSRDESATKPEGLEQTRFSFNADDTGELKLAGIDGWMRCRFGETLDGWPMFRFTWEGDADGKASKGTGYGILSVHDDHIRGEIKIGRRFACGFEAVRVRPRPPVHYDL